MSLFGINLSGRHHDYYLETVVFKVEQSLFRVPRYQFERHSDIFADMFTVPQPADSAQSDGSDDEIPLKLEGIKALDFQRLLQVLYPLTAIPKTPEMLPTGWLSVLKLATLWHFLEIRNLAIEKLTLHAGWLGSIERILLAKQYDVSAWLRSGYTDLARRKEPISLEEAAKIGWELKLVGRPRCRSTNCGRRQSHPQSCPRTNIELSILGVCSRQNSSGQTRRTRP
ncbi:hypothetical protein B0H17DRAFT_377824 [Mycena rosella]|uniref:BTB domain-containing protein n=1 Tax=Mycena rosella TaxID=1033263 RepID=A0AAD7CNR6_MYCRO|nr:hypothetical protein B0H17DRAFT_377824 [Mycena rosella]